MVIPGITSLLLTLLWEPINFTLLPVGFYVPLIAGVWGVYFGANLTEKLKPFQPKEPPPVDFLEEVVEDVGDDSGGQPQGTDNP
jgi:hypothetical protein